jgi:UDP-N-acetylglucosamine 2-epimerase
MFFTLGKLDTELINNKFKNAKCKVIGYLRYKKLNSKEEILNELNYDLKLNKNNKKIFWIPTHMNYQDEKLLNIFSWIENISNLCKEYDVIVRPHPKSIKTDFSIIEKFSKKGFFIDQLSNRKIGNLFKIADLVLADYGGAVFSAIYMEKPLLLLNIDENSKFFHERKNSSAEFILRNEIVSVYPGASHSEIRDKCNQALSEEYKKKIVKIKNKYFGNEKETLSSDKIVKFLLNKLSN